MYCLPLNPVKLENTYLFSSVDFFSILKAGKTPQLVADEEQGTGTYNCLVCLLWKQPKLNQTDEDYWPQRRCLCLSVCVPSL